MRDEMKWHVRYLAMAKLIASWSKDPSTKCGAVIVNADNEVVSIGFNGFPRGVYDSPRKLNDRAIKLAMTLHAERNAILFAKQSLKGCTIYTWPMHACSECAAMIIQAGFWRHITMAHNNARWQESWNIARDMFNEANVDVIMIEEDLLGDYRENI
jgi:dCMP deaminase